MNKSVTWLALCLSISAGCKTAPVVETCLIGETSLICHDPRRDPSDYELSFELARDYFATNVDDLNALLEYCERRGK